MTVWEPIVMVEDGVVLVRLIGWTVELQVLS